MSYENYKRRYANILRNASSRDDTLDNRGCYRYGARRRGHRSLADVDEAVDSITAIIDAMVDDIDKKVDDIEADIDAHLDSLSDEECNDGIGDCMRKSKDKKKKKKKSKDTDKVYKVDEFGRRMHKLYYGAASPDIKTYDGKKHTDDDMKGSSMDDSHDDLRNIDDYERLRHGSLSQRIFVALTGSDDDEDGCFWDENGELRHRWSPFRLVLAYRRDGSVNIGETIEAWLIVTVMTGIVLTILYLCFALFSPMPIGAGFMTILAFTALITPAAIISVSAHDEGYKKTAFVATCATAFLIAAAIGGYFDVAGAYSDGDPVETTRAEITTKVDGDTLYVNGGMSVLADGVEEKPLLDYLDDVTSLGVGSTIDDDELEVKIDDKAEQPYVTTERVPSEFHADRLSLFGNIANSIVHYGDDDGFDEPVLYLPKDMKVSFDIP